MPILFLPIFLKYFGFKKSVVFYTLVILGCAALLIPFYSPVFIDNYTETVGLWFSNFEFNASMYNVVKKIAVTYYKAKPWELIDSYGSMLTKAIIVIVLLFAFLRKTKNWIVSSPPWCLRWPVTISFPAPFIRGT